MKTHHKSSKRKKLSTKYNIAKRVREHKRRVKKEAKRLGIKKKVRKDPGIPNTWPFKAEMLQELEEQKEKREKEMLERRKTAKRQSQKDVQADAAERRKLLQERDALRREKRAADVEQAQVDIMHRILCGSDILIEVLDARDPLGCRCAVVEKWSVEQGRRLVFALTKADLVSPQVLAHWIAILGREAPTVAVAPEAGRDGVLALLHLLGHGPGAAGDAPLKAEAVGVVGYAGTGKKALCRAMRQENKGVATWMLDGAGKLLPVGPWADALAPLRLAVRAVLPLTAAPATKGSTVVAATSEHVAVVQQLLANSPAQAVLRRFRLPGFEGAEGLLQAWGKDKSAKTKKGKEPGMPALARLFLADLCAAPGCHVAPPPTEQAAVGQAALWGAYAARRPMIEAAMQAQATALAARDPGPAAGGLAIGPLAGSGPLVDLTEALADADEDAKDADAGMDGDSDDGEELGESEFEGEESEEEDDDMDE